MEKENKLVYIDENGNEVLCEILFTFDSDEFNKSYVLFYPVGDENEEDIEVMAASFIPAEDGTVGELNEIETDEEWALIEDTLNTFAGDDCDCGHDHEGCGCGCGCEDEDCDCEDDCDCNDEDCDC